METSGRGMTDLSLTLSPESLDAIAEKVAERVLAGLESTSSNGLGLAGLITLDQLVAELPPTKKASTWKAWLYEYVRRPDEVTAMGACKLAGSWHFDREKVQAWLVGRY